MATQQAKPLNEQQLQTFVGKLAAWREGLEPHEQAALDVLVLRAGMEPETADVSGYDGGLAGDNYVPDPEVAGIVPYRYAGPTYVAYPGAPAYGGYNYYVPVHYPWGAPGLITNYYGPLIRRY